MKTYNKMHALEQAEAREVLKEKVVKFLENLSHGEKAGKDFQFMSAKKGKKYCEYIGDDAIWYVAFDGSSLYDAFNHCDEPHPYDRDSKWHEFCEENGIWSEMGHSWNMSIYPSNKK